MARCRASARPTALVALVLLALCAGGAVAQFGCDFKCPHGDKPKPKPGYVPESNGCGTAGLKLDVGFGLEECCDEHDLCYGTCGTTFNKCEANFNTCMKRVCDAQRPADKESCEGTKQMMVMGTGLLGCGTFVNSQKEACVCKSVESVRNSAGARARRRAGGGHGVKVQDMAPPGWREKDEQRKAAEAFVASAEHERVAAAGGPAAARRQRSQGKGGKKKGRRARRNLVDSEADAEPPLGRRPEDLFKDADAFAAAADADTEDDDDPPAFPEFDWSQFDAAANALDEGLAKSGGGEDAGAGATRVGEGGDAPAAESEEERALREELEADRRRFDPDPNEKPPDIGRYTSLKAESMRNKAARAARERARSGETNKAAKSRLLRDTLRKMQEMGDSFEMGGDDGGSDAEL